MGKRPDWQREKCTDCEHVRWAHDDENGCCANADDGEECDCIAFNPFEKIPSCTCDLFDKKPEDECICHISLNELAKELWKLRKMVNQ